MPSIAAVLIVRNEEDTLGACLESLRCAADEIVVCDTGSTDRTIAIAEAYGARVCHCAWREDFAAARNFALEHAQSDWVLGIDADEQIEDPEAAGHFLSAFVENRDARTVGTVEIVNVVGAGASAQEVIDQTERFFPRATFHYEGAIHEQILPRTGVKLSAPTGVRLLHSGYLHIEEKAARNKRLLEAESARHPNDEYVLYQLGKAHFSLKEYREAAAALETAARLIRFEEGAAPQGRLGPVSREVLTGLAVSLAYAYVNTDKTDQAAALLEEHARRAHAGKQFPRLLHRQFQHLGNIQSLVPHRQRLAGEAPPLAGRAAHFHIRQKVHLDAQHPRSFAALAAPAGHVEGKGAGCQPAAARLRAGGKSLADRGEDVRIGRGIRARDAPNVRLVDADDPSHLLKTLDPFMLARDGSRCVQALAHRRVQDIKYQR